MNNYDKVRIIIVNGCYWYGVKDAYWIADYVLQKLKSEGLIAKDENISIKTAKQKRRKKNE